MSQTLLCTCTYYTYLSNSISVIEGLGNCQILAANAVAEAEKFLKYQYSKAPGAIKKEIDIRKGTFLNEDNWLALWADTDDEEEEEEEDDEDKAAVAGPSTQTTMPPLNTPYMVNGVTCIFNGQQRFVWNGTKWVVG